MALSSKDIDTLMGIVLKRMADLLSFNMRTVLFEKWREPSHVTVSGLHPEFEYYTEEIDGYYFDLFGPSRQINELEAEISWHDSAGLLHNNNDMPARIIINSFTHLSLEWFRHGVPFRKKELFNVIKIQQEYSYSPKKKLSGRYYEVEWLNQDGKLHSFNGMPAKISKDTVEWYWNGENCRMGQYCDLPCSITMRGMTFRRNKHEAPHTVNIAAMRDYAPICRKDLHLYEHYVCWPIRKLLTL